MTMPFKPVRDPVTGRLDMIREVEPEWGEYGRSEGVRNALGHERYDELHPDDFGGAIATVEDLHDAVLVEITSLLAPHCDDGALGKLARSWIDATRLVRDRRMAMATIAFTANGTDSCGGKTLTVVNVTDKECVLVSFCPHGEVNTDPVAHWNDGGSFSTALVDDESLDDAMLDHEVQMRRWDMTETAVAAARAQAKRPEGVVDMAAFRTLRAVGRGV